MKELLHARGGDWLLVFDGDDWETPASIRAEEVVGVHIAPHPTLLGGYVLRLALRGGGSMQVIAGNPLDVHGLDAAYHAVCAAIGFTDTQGDGLPEAAE